MRKEKIRVGIVGPSWWTDLWFVPALKAHPDAEVVAICGQGSEHASAMATRLGNPPTFTDVKEMLDQVKLDAVTVVLPNDLHHPIAMLALQRGLHVCTEKPMALNATQAREMLDMARRQKAITMVNFTYRDNPAVLEMRRVLQEGELGSLIYANFSYVGGYALRGRPGWRGQRDRSGAGILGDLGSHIIDLCRWITGEEITAVTSDAITMVNDRPVPAQSPQVGPLNDDSVAFISRLSSGAHSCFHTSWATAQGSRSQTIRIEIAGTKAFAVMTADFEEVKLSIQMSGEPSNRPILLSIGPKISHEQESPQDRFRPWRLTASNSVYRWLDAIAGDEFVKPDFDDGYRTQRVIDAVIEADRQRRWVDI